ncbi:tomoregulin-2 isoform X1 [Cygnus olor]|uniref:tomoregulin-2 isoform X1 n=1 Tax=Cygnus olor TaxID=8869 RepID=UPI001ADDF7B9|nr:tomoregulin-2 isoform X1 [Cygnus olor]
MGDGEHFVFNTGESFPPSTWKQALNCCLQSFTWELNYPHWFCAVAKATNEPQVGWLGSRSSSQTAGSVSLPCKKRTLNKSKPGLLLLPQQASYDDRENDLFLCDTNTCKFDGECLRIGDSVTCVCQFKCNNDYVPVCGSNGDTYQNECYLKQAACKQQSEILLVSEGSCATDAGSGSGDGVNEGSGETNQKETSTCDICQFGAECDEDAEDVWCVCNIDCSQTNFNPLCASDGKSYDNACQIKEASCQKQEKIEVMSLGRCQDNTTATTKSEDGHYARTDYAENANKLEESARGIYIPCPEHYNGFCMHGKCEHSTNMLEPSCRCDAGYTGQHCEKKDYSVLYVVPGPVRFQYVLIAAVIGTIQIAIICVVVLCITRKCPRSNRIHRQKQNTGHYSSDNTTRASTSSSGNFESTELSSRVLSWSKISDNYGCGKGEE